MEFNKSWNEYILYDLANWKNGLAFKDINFSNKGKPIIKIAELKNGITEQTKYTDGDYGEEVYLRKNDLIFSWSGNPKTSIDAFLYDLPEGYLNQHSFKITEKKEVVEKYFLYYVLKYLNPMFQSIASDKQTTGLGHVTIADLKKIKVRIPDLEVQYKILNIVKNIDDKIYNNNQINDNLSEQLQLIYDEWFGKYEMDNLPDGWKIEKLKNIATFSQGVQVPIDKQIYEEECGYTRFIRIVDITQKNDKDIRYIEDTERGKVEENEIFMIRYGTPGILSWNYKGIIANNLFKITPKVNYISSNFLYSYFNNNKFQRYIKGNATSSTMPAINFSTLNDRDIIIPTTDLINKFNEISETIRLKQLSISNQNKILSDLRDTLLPKLMNGEIELDKIEI